MSKTNRDKCDKCDGCGEIANDDDGTPWKYWQEMPAQSALAVAMGLVRPVECPECRGTGVKQNPAGEAQRPE